MKDVISALSFVASSIFVCIFDPKNGFDGLIMSGSGATKREESMAIMETENSEYDPCLYMSKRRSHCRFSALQGEIQDLTVTNLTTAAHACFMHARPLFGTVKSVTVQLQQNKVYE